MRVSLAKLYYTASTKHKVLECHESGLIVADQGGVIWFVDTDGKYWDTMMGWGD